MSSFVFNPFTAFNFAVATEIKFFFILFISIPPKTRREEPTNRFRVSVRLCVCVLFPLNNNLMREKAKQMQGTMLLSGVNRIPVVLPPLLLFLLLAAATPGEFLFCLLLHFISFYFFFTLHSTESHCSSSLHFFPSAPSFFQYVFGVPFFLPEFFNFIQI